MKMHFSFTFFHNAVLLQLLCFVVASCDLNIALSHITILIIVGFNVQPYDLLLY